MVSDGVISLSLLIYMLSHLKYAMPKDLRGFEAVSRALTSARAKKSCYYIIL